MDDRPRDDAPQPGQSLAVWAQLLYLANLLILPGVAFAMLFWLWLRHRRSAPSLARCHLRQTVVASLWAGVLLVLVSGVLLYAGGFTAPYTWVVVILYFTLGHTTLVFLGIAGLAKAMAGHAFRYPLVGAPCDP